MSPPLLSLSLPAHTHHIHTGASSDTQRFTHIFLFGRRRPSQHVKFSLAGHAAQGGARYNESLEGWARFVSALYCLSRHFRFPCHRSFSIVPSKAVADVIKELKNMLHFPREPFCLTLAHSSPCPSVVPRCIRTNPSPPLLHLLSNRGHYLVCVVSLQYCGLKRHLKLYRSHRAFNGI